MHEVVAALDIMNRFTLYSNRPNEQPRTRESPSANFLMGRLEDEDDNEDAEDEANKDEDEDEILKTPPPLIPAACK